MEKLITLNKISEAHTNLMREINGLMSSIEKTPHRKKKESSIQENSIQKLGFLTENIEDVLEEAILAKNFMINYAKKENWGNF